MKSFINSIIFFTFILISIPSICEANTISGNTRSSFIHKANLDGINTLTICDPQNGNACITMMDRNLGAEKAGTECNSANSGACGYHFQWGNNHGFKIGCWTDGYINGWTDDWMDGCSDEVTKNITSIFAKYNPIYENNGYYGAEFFVYETERKKWEGQRTLIIGLGDYREDNKHYDGLWGGSGDSDENGRGYDIENNVATNVTGRQGPCPVGYHIPSHGEFSKLFDYWVANYRLEGNKLSVSGEEDHLKFLKFFGLNENSRKASSQFILDFDVPTNGSRSYNEGKLFFGKYIGGSRWSSTPGETIIEDGIVVVDSSDHAKPFSMGEETVATNYESDRTSGLPIRCFKNIAITGNYDFFDEYTTDTNEIDDYLNDITGKNNEYISYITGFNTNFSSEENEAYQFAYNYYITTKDSIENADMYGGLTRIAMAKMLSQYAINILGKSLDLSETCFFNDVPDELDKQYNNGVMLACHLGIMGKNMTNNNFRPYDLVTRAEFGTALSRMLFNTPDGTDKYYSTHLSKLRSEGIISNDNPLLKELRGYVMLMLMRSSK